MIEIGNHIQQPIVDKSENKQSKSTNRTFLSVPNQRDTFTISSQQNTEKANLFGILSGIIAKVTKENSKISDTQENTDISINQQKQPQITEEYLKSLTKQEKDKEVPRFSAEERQHILELAEQNSRLVNAMIKESDDNEAKSQKFDVSQIEEVVKLVNNSSDITSEDYPAVMELSNPEDKNLLEFYKKLPRDIKQKINAELTGDKSILKGNLSNIVYAASVTPEKKQQFEAEGYECNIDDNLFKRIDYIKQDSKLKAIPAKELGRFTLYNFDTLKKGINILDNVDNLDKIDPYDFHIFFIFDKVKRMLDINMPTKDVVNHGFFDAWILLKQQNPNLSTEAFFDKVSAKASKEHIMKNVDYIVQEQKNGKLTSVDDIAGILNFDVDYKAQKDKYKNSGLDEDSIEVLARTEDTAKQDKEIISGFVSNIKNNTSKVSAPEIADFVNKTKTDLKELSDYMYETDFDNVKEIAPAVKDFTSKDIINFADYHYKTGDTKFTRDSLTLTDDFTDFLSHNYIDGENLGKIIAAFPATNRNIGTLPDDWIDNSENKQEVQDKIQTVIDNFRKTGDRENRDISVLQKDLSSVLQKQVDIKSLGAGEFGTGYKISVEGAKPVVLKLYHKVPGNEGPRNGQHIEVQAGLFANKHSNDFVKMYFGRVSGNSNEDGYSVTQFIDDTTIPEENKNISSGYTVTSKDVREGHNLIKGKIIDYGAIYVKKDDETPIPDGIDVATECKNNLK